MNILNTIGNTPLVQLQSIVPAGSARIFVKLESHNPTGSMKDRMARAMVESAIKSGALADGQELVEFTGGSTGTSLAFVCAALGYSVSIVTSDAFSIEKRNHMKAFGAVMTIVPSQGGRMPLANTSWMSCVASSSSCCADLAATHVGTRPLTGVCASTSESP